MAKSEPQNLFGLENLEQRILLSGDSLLGAAAGVLTDELEAVSGLELGIPPIEETLLSNQDQPQKDTFLDTRHAKPVFNYFADAVDPPDTTGLLLTLHQPPETVENLDIALNSLEGGFALVDNELRFDLNLTATRTSEVCLDAESDNYAGIAFDEQFQFPIPRP